MPERLLSTCWADLLTDILFISAFVLLLVLLLLFLPSDTCIIFDSDWNPQSDLQAQARCHRIGQTKNVQVYRLLTRKTYEMQMFHMSSLKMGLDQAVLQGFESGGSEDVRVLLSIATCCFACVPFCLVVFDSTDGLLMSRCGYFVFHTWNYIGMLTAVTVIVVLSLLFLS